MSQIRQGDHISAVAPLVWDSAENIMQFDDFELSVIGELPGVASALTWDAEARELEFDHSRFWQVYAYASYPEVGAFIKTPDGSAVSVLSPSFNVYRTIDPADAQDVGFSIWIDSDKIPRFGSIGADTERELRFYWNSADQWKIDQTGFFPLGDEDKAIGSVEKQINTVCGARWYSDRWANVEFDDQFGSAIQVNRDWNNSTVNFPEALLHFDLNDHGQALNNNTERPVIKISVTGNDAVLDLEDSPLVDRFIVDTLGNVRCQAVYATNVYVSTDPYGSTTDTLEIVGKTLTPVTAMAGTSNSTTAFNTGNVTTQQLAQRVKFLESVLVSAGLLVT